MRKKQAEIEESSSSNKTEVVDRRPLGRPRKRVRKAPFSDDTSNAGESGNAADCSTSAEAPSSGMSEF